MNSFLFADTVLFISLATSLGTYVLVSKREGTYLNILTPSFLIGIPAFYLLPLFFTHFVGNDASPYAYIYVYATIAAENVAFAYAYLRPTRRVIRLPFRYSYHNFDKLSLVSLALGFLMYLPILLEFPEYILSPRQIYANTRTGFGVNFYISSTLAYLAVIFIQFSAHSWRRKWSVILAAAFLLSLHGSKGQVISLFFLLALYEVLRSSDQSTLFAVADGSWRHELLDAGALCLHHGSGSRSSRSASGNQRVFRLHSEWDVGDRLTLSAAVRTSHT